MKFNFTKLGAGALIVFFAMAAHANTTTAASPAFADVSAAINNSSPGDTVIIPPGTATWTQPLAFRDISLVGSGTNLTVIIDGLDRNANPNPPLIFVHGGGGTGLQIGNFQLAGGNTTRNWHGEIATDCSGPIRIHDIYFNKCFDKALMLYGANLSLVDHCYFRLTYAGILIRDLGWGDASWATPPNYGTMLMPVVEDCVFTNLDHYSSSDNAVDCEWGGRCTFRHNLVYFTFFEAHGTESGGRNRGGRVFEIYSNNFIHDPAVAFPSPVNLRAGSGVFYGNTASGYSYFANINVNRSTESFLPWGRGDGASVWDDNTGINYLAGTHSGPSGVNYLQVAGANWTVNQWVGYTVVNRDFGGGNNANYNYSVITSNNLNQVFYHISKDYGFMKFANGNQFVINKVNRVLDQPGLGSGDLIQGEMQPWGPDPINTAFGVAAWPRQNVEGIYSWNNTLNGANAGFGSDYPHVRAGRDFFNDTPKPGYAPLIYPHPLQTGTNPPAGSGSSLQPPVRVWVQQ